MKDFQLMLDRLAQKVSFTLVRVLLRRKPWSGGHVEEVVSLNPSAAHLLGRWIDFHINML